MKLGYLAVGSIECPLIRLYGFDQTEVRELRQLVKSLSDGSAQQVTLKEKAWIQSVGGCDIKFLVGDRDEGVRQHGPLNFECVLTSDGWRNVEGLLEPFCEPNASGYQWLIQSGKTSLLLSHDGQW